MLEAILDLRGWAETVDSASALGRLWAEIGPTLNGRAAETGRFLEVRTSGGVAKMWIVSAPPGLTIAPETPVSILDLARNPKLIYVCRDCGEYGPLRCLQCDDEDQPGRLCSKHAHTIKDELTAYCKDHAPACECRKDCQEPAVFRCRKCGHLFGVHQEQLHPRDRDISYCKNCHWHLFGRCQVCAANRRQRLGKSKCGFFLRDRGEKCLAPLCWEHSQQWRAWGEKNRGIPLCPDHVRALSTIDLESILLSLLSTQPPLSDRGRRMPLPNLFRVRKLLKTYRARPESFQTILEAVRRLGPEIEVRKNDRLARDYRYMCDSYTEALSDLAQKEAPLLGQIRAYYSQQLGSGWADRIVSAEIVDRWKDRAKNRWLYRLDVRTTLGDSDKGKLIGPKGQRIKPLEEAYGISMEFDGGRR